jgi:hypothetical protein
MIQPLDRCIARCIADCRAGVKPIAITEPERVAANHPATPSHQKNIMKLSKFCSFAVLSIAASVAPALAIAQQETAPVPPPPQMENLNEVEAPSVTIQTPSEQRQKTITEKRDQGRVTEVKVEGPNSTYYLRPRTTGTSITGAADSPPQTNPQWQIKEFDWGGKKKAKPAPDAADAAPGQ